MKKGRERSIIDMVTTLCNHLSNREEEINTWVEFADKVAITAADKLEHSMQEYQVICESKNEAQKTMNNAQRAMLNVREEVALLKKELENARNEVLEILLTFPPIVSDLEAQLRRQLREHCDSVRSECKSEACDAIESVSRSHDDEKQRLETVIGSLQMSLQEEEKKVQSLKSQLGHAEAELETEKEKHMAAQGDLMADADRARSGVQDAKEKIKSLENQLECEKIAKNREVDAVEEKMKAELEKIDQKVKLMIESKNREIENARQRAHTAEASAKAAERLLSELKARVFNAS